MLLKMNLLCRRRKIIFNIHPMSSYFVPSICVTIILFAILYDLETMINKLFIDY